MKSEDYYKKMPRQKSGQNQNSLYPFDKKN